MRRNLVTKIYGNKISVSQPELQAERLDSDLKADTIPVCRIKAHLQSMSNVYSGYWSIFTRDREIQVDKILDMWLAPDHRYFNFLGSDGGEYIIRNDPHRHFWELTCFKQQSGTDSD